MEFAEGFVIQASKFNANSLITLLEPTYLTNCFNALIILNAVILIFYLERYLTPFLSSSKIFFVKPDSTLFFVSKTSSKSTLKSHADHINRDLTLTFSPYGAHYRPISSQKCCTRCNICRFKFKSVQCRPMYGLKHVSFLNETG